MTRVVTLSWIDPTTPPDSARSVLLSLPASEAGSWPGWFENGIWFSTDGDEVPADEINGWAELPKAWGVNG